MENSAKSSRRLRRWPVLLGCAFMAVVAMSISTASGQAPKKAAPARKANLLRTPWGDPDIQGVWNDATSTPLQRPGTVGAKDVLSDEEAEEMEALERTLLEELGYPDPYADDEHDEPPHSATPSKDNE